jgi:hypothetical protein
MKCGIDIVILTQDQLIVNREQILFNLDGGNIRIFKIGRYKVGIYKRAVLTIFDLRSQRIGQSYSIGEDVYSVIRFNNSFYMIINYKGIDILNTTRKEIIPTISLEGVKHIISYSHYILKFLVNPNSNYIVTYNAVNGELSRDYEIMNASYYLDI